MWLQLPLDGAHLHSALRKNLSNEVMWPRICYYIFAGGGRRLYLSTTSRTLPPWESIRQTLTQMVSISIPRYWALLVSLRSDFSQQTTNPRSLQSCRSSWCSNRWGANIMMTTLSSQMPSLADKQVAHWICPPYSASSLVRIHPQTNLLKYYEKRHFSRRNSARNRGR